MSNNDNCKRLIDAIDVVKNHVLIAINACNENHMELCLSQLEAAQQLLSRLEPVANQVDFLLEQLRRDASK